MDYIVLGNIAYSISGGVQVVAGETYSDADFTFSDLPPSTVAQLRTSSDARTLFQTTLFGRGVNSRGTFAPNDDDGRTAPSIGIFKCFQVNAQEVASTGIKDILDLAMLNSLQLEKLRLYRQALNNGDITQAKVQDITDKINLAWTQFRDCIVSSSQLVTGGQSSITVVASGIPLISNCSYEYQPRWGFGTLQIKLLQLWQK